MPRLIDADTLERDGWSISRTVQINEKTMELQTRKPTDFLAVEPQPEIIYCHECKYWRQQTSYAGVPLSFGFCESDDMWRSLCGETYEVSHIETDDDFFCGHAGRREE